MFRPAFQAHCCLTHFRDTADFECTSKINIKRSLFPTTTT